MPTYAYRCRKCEHAFEEFHGIHDNKPRKCPQCGARADRVPAGGAGLLFKGSGFYITDYRSKAYTDSAKKDKAGAEGASKPAGDGGKKSDAGVAPNKSSGSATGKGGTAGASGKPSAGD